MGFSVPEGDVHHSPSAELANVNAAEVAGSLAPAADGAPPVVEVVPVEVGIAPETNRALGLFRGSQRRHVFLPLCLLGPIQNIEGKDVFKGTAAPAGESWDGHGMLSTQKPLESQEATLPYRYAFGSPSPQSLLEELKKAVCKALKLGENFCGGLPLQLVAQVSAPKTKCRTALQSDSLAASHLPTGDGLESPDRPLPAWHSLVSEEEALRILREHYGPLLAQYRRLSHSQACLPPNRNSSVSQSTDQKDDFKGNSILRILRLPRGPRLSLLLQLEPPLPTIPFSTSDAMNDLPSPPPLGAAKKSEVGKGSTPAVPSPYQLVSLYKFFPVSSPNALTELLRALWGPKGVLGRAYVAKEGLNAQLAVPSVAMSDLLGELHQIPGLEDGMQVTLDCLVTFEEYWNSPPFDALHIRPRHQVLRDGFASPLNWADCGEEVDPSVWHNKLTEMLQQQQRQQQPIRKMVLLDMRNADEYAVGHFKGAKCIDTPTFADSFRPGGPLEEALLRAGIQLPSRNATSPSPSTTCIGEDVEVLMYCTGGIRCVKAGAFLKQVLGFPRVTRLKGGILAYKNYIQSLRGACLECTGRASSDSDEKEPSIGVCDSRRDDVVTCDTGVQAKEQQTAADRTGAEAADVHAFSHRSLFVGSNYVFDHRMCQQITPDLLAQCILCGGPSGRLSNCSNRQCGRRVVLCSGCCASLGVYCSSTCAQQGAEDRQRDAQAKMQRRMQAQYTHKRLLKQRGLWAIRAQQLLAALKHNAASESPVESPPSLRNSEMDKASLDESRAVAEKTTTADLWNWAHHVAAAASSPSAVQEALLEEGRNTAKSFVGAAKGVRQFWSGQLHSRILSAISRLKRPRSILEIGAFVGISSLALAEGLACEEIVPGECVGLVSIEKDPRAAEAARRLVNSSPWAHLIKVVEADALQWIRSQLTATRNISSGTVDSEGARLGTAPLQGSTLPDRGFDLIYLDAEKKKYAEYVETILDPQRPLLAPDGALLIDNTLWSTGHDGTRPLWWEDSVAEEDPPRAKRYARIAESIKALRETLRNDTRISHVLLPVGDGLSIVTWATPASHGLP
ncbi:hypothetical protein, conserved [Eimeria maxima]|uniref:Rhodanese domain-containing protein n=1 Tax=Eimeria maxima TaxID=5804 RepID=U6MBG9_EIMMA|nr:hypothetical protein, conserved [Eimeria maxima]CDJ60403.1 hypothetical protein, conserved [Eimeria maxima]